MKKVLTISLYILKNWYKWWVQLLTIISDVKIYKTPCFAIYNPEEYDYSIRGNQIRQICNLVKPGDIILRGYKHYLDGFLIPGKYSHVGIYIGEHIVVHAVAEGVKEIDIIDFLLADRVCILRPNSKQDNAVQYVKEHIGSKYDFKFNSSDSSEFYCFELAAKAYSNLNVLSFDVELYNIPLKFLTPKYTDKSFLNNKNFEKIIEI